MIPRTSNTSTIPRKWLAQRGATFRQKESTSKLDWKDYLPSVKSLTSGCVEKNSRNFLIAQQKRNDRNSR